MALHGHGRQKPRKWVLEALGEGSGRPRGGKSEAHPPEPPRHRLKGEPERLKGGMLRYLCTGRTVFFRAPAGAALPAHPARPRGGVLAFKVAALGCVILPSRTTGHQQYRS